MFIQAVSVSWALNALERCATFMERNQLFCQTLFVPTKRFSRTGHTSLQISWTSRSVHRVIICRCVQISVWPRLRERFQLVDSGKPPSLHGARQQYSASCHSYAMYESFKNSLRQISDDVLFDNAWPMWKPKTIFMFNLFQNRVFKKSLSIIVSTGWFIFRRC